MRPVNPIKMFTLTNSSCRSRSRNLVRRLRMRRNRMLSQSAFGYHSWFHSPQIHWSEAEALKMATTGKSIELSVLPALIFGLRLEANNEFRAWEELHCHLTESWLKSIHVVQNVHMRKGRSSDSEVYGMMTTLWYEMVQILENLNVLLTAFNFPLLK